MPLPKLSTNLRGTTLIVSVASAVCAYPAAAAQVGPYLGTIAVGALGIVTMSCWHYAGTQKGSDETSWAHRIGASAIACLAAGVMMKGIVVSADLAHQNKVTQANAPATQLYQEQEATRLALVKTLSAKLAATDNRADPKDYKDLSQKLEKAMIPTAKPETEQSAVPVIPVEHKWSVAATFEGSILIMMILAGLLDRREEREKDQLPTVAQPVAQGQQQGNSPATSNSPDYDPDPMEIFSGKVVPLNDAGAVTIQAIVDTSGKSPKQARALRDQAQEEGWLYATGNGNAKSYFYWDYIQPETQLPLLRSVK